jgi:hypothetical protein
MTNHQWYFSYEQLVFRFCIPHAMYSSGYFSFTAGSGAPEAPFVQVFSSEREEWLTLSMFPSMLIPEAMNNTSSSSLKSIQASASSLSSEECVERCHKRKRSEIDSNENGIDDEEQENVILLHDSQIEKQIDDTCSKSDVVTYTSSLFTNDQWKMLNSDLKCYILSFVPSRIILKAKHVEFSVNGYEFLRSMYVSGDRVEILEKSILSNLYGRMDDNQIRTLFLPKISIDDFNEFEPDYEQDCSNFASLRRKLQPVIPWYSCSTLKIPLSDLIQIGIRRLSKTHYPQKIKLMCTHDDIINNSLLYCSQNQSIVDILSNREYNLSGLMRRFDVSVCAGYITNKQFNCTIKKLSELPQFNKCEIRTGFGLVYTIDGELMTDASDIDFTVLKALVNCKSLKLHYSEFEAQLTDKNIAQILNIPNITHLTIKMMHDMPGTYRFSLKTIDRLKNHPSLRKLNLQCDSILGNYFLEAIAQNRRITSLKLRFPLTIGDIIKILGLEQSKLKRLKIGINSGINLDDELIDSFIRTKNKTLKSLYIRGSLDNGSHCCIESLFKFIRYCTSCKHLVYFEKVGSELLKRTFERHSNSPSGILNGIHEITVS